MTQFGDAVRTPRTAIEFRGNPRPTACTRIKARDEEKPLLTESVGSSLPAQSCDAVPVADTSFVAGQFRIVACSPAHSRRAEAEAFVREGFYATHGARVQSIMPTLLAMTDASGALCGVTGCRVADAGPLFLESYLPHPVDEVLASRTGARIRRAEIVEVGNFACRSSQMARAFMRLLPRYLLEQNLVWITFTATVSVRRILRHLGARCMDLGPAEGACVRNGKDDWGRYYANDPRVMSGYLPLARRIPMLWSTPHAN